MKITAERSALLKTLAHVQSVVERRNTIPVLSNVLIKAEGGRLQLVATDLDIQITDSCEAQVDTPGSTTVPAATLHDIVRKLAADEVQLEIVDGRMRVISGRSRFNVPVLPAEDFPLMATGEMEHNFALTTTSLQHALKCTRYAISNEEARYYLNGVFMHVTEEGLIAAATDGHRLAQAHVDTGEAAMKGMPDIIVPRKTVSELLKLIGEFDGDVEINVSRGKIVFEIGRLTLISKTIDGTFPDYTRVIPTGNDMKVQISTKALADAIDRVSTIASEKTRAVKMSVDGNTITLAVSSPENGTATEEIACEAKGKIEVGFNAGYLNEMLSHIESDSVELSFSDPSSPVLVTDLTREKDSNVLMPMRV